MTVKKPVLLPSGCAYPVRVPQGEPDNVLKQHQASDRGGTTPGVFHACCKILAKLSDDCSVIPVLQMTKQRLCVLHNSAQAGVPQSLWSHEALVFRGWGWGWELHFNGIADRGRCVSAQFPHKPLTLLFFFFLEPSLVFPLVHRGDHGRLLIWEAAGYA